jgi:hypothetical protein
VRARGVQTDTSNPGWQEGAIHTDGGAAAELSVTSVPEGVGQLHVDGDPDGASTVCGHCTGSEASDS